MTIRQFACVLLGMTVALAGYAAAEDVEDLLKRLPAQNTADATNINQGLLALGPEGITALSLRLTPSGVEDDTPVRYALNGLAKYVSSGEREADRTAVAKALGTGIAKAEHDEVKAFLIRQIEVAGGAESVDCLAALLSHVELGGPAARALQAIRTPEAAAALQAALPEASAEQRAALLQALGAFDALPDATKVAAYAKDDDEAVRTAALYALAKTGAPEADALLAAELQNAEGNKRDILLAYQQCYVESLAERNPPRESVPALRKMLSGPGGDGHLRAATLQTLVNLAGEDALPDLIAAMEDGDKGYRGAALMLASRLPGSAVTKKWGEAAKKSPPAVRAEIVGMLRTRVDDEARRILRDTLEDADPQVRIAALGGIASVGKNKAVSPVVSLLAKAEESSEIRAAQQALLCLPAKRTVNEAANALRRNKGLSSGAQKVLITVLRERESRKHIDLIMALAREADGAASVTAWDTLALLAEAGHLEELITGLLDAEGSAQTRAAQAAVVAVAKRQSTAKKRLAILTAPIAQATPEQQGRLYAVLAELGDGRALDYVAERTLDANTEVAAAAVEALAACPHAEATMPLLDVIERPEAPGRAAALDGYLRLTRRATIPAEDKVWLFRQAMAAAQSVEEKHTVLDSLAELRDPGAVELAGTLLPEEELAPAVAEATMKMVLPEGDYKGMTDFAARATFERALPLIDDEALRERAKAHLATMATEAPTAAIPWPTDEPGFVSLFDGRSLAGWHGDTRAYTAEYGKLVCQKGGSGNLHTKEEFCDFVLRFAFRLAPGANNGLGIRTPGLSTHAAYDGMELQIIDNTAEEFADLKDYQFHGSVYGVKPALRGHLRPVGQWNHQEVAAQGTSITVRLNGQEILAVDLEKFRGQPTPDGKEHPGLHRPCGTIAFLGHGDRVEFRDIVLRPIAKP